MVGKGDAKGSRIFHQCYVKCCKLQNLTPMNAVIPSENGKMLDFCVDRIKYVEWPPILNALSCDLSLHSLGIRCRQQVKTVLEHIDCERLAKTVNKRSVILTRFMLSNLLEAVFQLLNNTTLLANLMFEGLPLKIPYLNTICEALLANNSLRHVFLPRCLVGDAGCLAICKAARCLPNILTLDLSGCEVTQIGAGYIADLLKYQKIHRYSENWVHTLRYQMPELDTMAGLRRISLCSNPLGDAGSAALLSVLADDLWIKAVDLQNCELSEQTATTVLAMMESNTTLVVVDLRHNDIGAESLAKVRRALRRNEPGGGLGQCYSWLTSVSSSSGDIRSVKPVTSRIGVNKDQATLASRNVLTKYPSNKTSSTKKEKHYAEVLVEQLNEEISYRQQLEALNLQLVEQMKQLKELRDRQWANATGSSGNSFTMKMTEIYDVTDADTDVVQSPTQRDVNKQFDSDWSHDLIAENDDELDVDDSQTPWLIATYSQTLKATGPVSIRWARAIRTNQNQIRGAMSTSKGKADGHLYHSLKVGADITATPDQLSLAK